MTVARADLTGRKFGKQFVLGPDAPLDASMKKYLFPWRVRCDCGNVRTISHSALVRGRGCGCVHRQRAKEANTKHGFAYGQRYGRRPERTYRIWQNMLNRCRNQKLPCWKNYGGRGIVVCERWQDFANFIADMGECPPGLSIDRINNDGNYEPSNCRWATRKQQSLNQRPRKSRSARAFTQNKEELHASP